VTTLLVVTELVAVPPEVTEIAVDVAVLVCAKAIVAITQSPMANALRTDMDPTILRERLMSLWAATLREVKTGIVENGSMMD
jgi:hypothetical protein